jgi:NAD+ synthase
MSGLLTDALAIDPQSAAGGIAMRLRTQVAETLGRRGLVVGMSGGVDSTVCAGLAVRALGKERVFGLIMPERDSSPDDAALALEWAAKLGIDHLTEDITPVLEGAGAYRRRDAAIRTLIPAYGDGWRCKITLGKDRHAKGQLSFFSLTVRAPDGETSALRLTPTVYREIVAATNFKQRARKMLEYYHGDRLHYAVIGTPNRLEYDQGFFVKGGDGLADVKPIAHLYKTQVYQLAEALGVPPGITNRPPTTGTYSLPQGQDEFYFTLPLRQMDLALYAADHGIGPEALAEELGCGVEAAAHVLQDIPRRRATTRYLHAPALLIEQVGTTG